MKKKVLLITLGLVAVLTACGSNTEEPVVEEDNTITVTESELIPENPVYIEVDHDGEDNPDKASVSENETKEFTNEFVETDQISELPSTPYKPFCTIIKNEFCAIAYQDVYNADNFIDIYIPDSEFARAIMSMDKSIEVYPEYKEASAEDTEFYNTYTKQEYIGIRPGLDFFEQQSDDEDEEEVQQDTTSQTQEVTDDAFSQEDTQETTENSDEQTQENSEQTEEQTQETAQTEAEPQEEQKSETNQYQLYELTGIRLRFGNKASSVITNKEQLETVLTEMGW